MTAETSGRRRPFNEPRPIGAADSPPTRECLAARVPRIEAFLRKRRFSDAVVSRAVEKTIDVAERFLETGRAHRLRHRVAWLYAVARQEAARAAMQEPTFVRMNLALMKDGGPRPGDDAEDRQAEAREAIQYAISRLTPKQGKAVELCYLEGNSLRQAAGLLGVSPGSLAGRLQLALKRMAEILGPDGTRGRRKMRGRASADPSK